jgi:hypothetical protein
MSDVIELSGNPMTVVVSDNAISIVTAAEQGIAGATGATGPAGATGAAGANGQGVPAGGSAGQVLAKNTGNNFDTLWQNANNHTHSIAAINAATTDRLFGRDTAGAGTGEELTIHQALDFASATNNRMLVRQSGVWSPVICSDSGVLPLTSAITWTGTTAPSGTTNHVYWWTRIGQMVNFSLSLNYATAGTALTQVQIDLPADCPAPFEWSGLTGASNKLYAGTGYINTSPTAAGSSSRVFLGKNAAATGYEIFAIAGSSSARAMASTTIRQRGSRSPSAA